jgi:osmoprotectant transport system substrate-binding protein
MKEHHMKRTRLTLAATMAVLALAVSACGNNNPTQTGSKATGSPAPSDTIVVGSANFQENVILANIYAQALQAQGATVSTQLNIGSRETYMPGLQDGSIDLIPEYSGVLLQYFDKKATAVSSDDVFAALPAALPQGLVVLDQSKAEDKDAIVVTKETADKYHLKSIADLAAKP